MFWLSQGSAGFDRLKAHHINVYVNVQIKYYQKPYLWVDVSGFWLLFFTAAVAMETAGHVWRKQQLITHLSQLCPSTLGLQWHRPSRGEQSSTLPLESHSHGLQTKGDVRIKYLNPHHLMDMQDIDFHDFTFFPQHHTWSATQQQF